MTQFRRLFLRGATRVARLRHSRYRQAFFWWPAGYLLLSVATAIRASMDDVGMPVHGSGLETGVFRILPSLWLQSHLYTRWPTVLGWAVVFVHGSWFFVPYLAAALVSWKRPERTTSLFLWWLAPFFLALPCFALLPVQPPWMANHEVVRVVAVRLPARIPDANPLAAMPSVHVALPLVMALWFFRERWKMPAMAMLAYSVLVAFEVVFSGEHYVLDVVGAVALSATIALASTFDYRTALNWTRSRAREVLGGAPAAPAAASRVPSRYRERAQAALEFTFFSRVIKPDASTAPGKNRRN